MKIWTCLSLLLLLGCGNVSEGGLESDTVNLCRNTTLPVGSVVSVPADDAPKASALNEWFWTTQFVGLYSGKKYSAETFFFSFNLGAGAAYIWNQVSITDPVNKSYRQGQTLVPGAFAADVNAFNLSFPGTGGPTAVGGGGVNDHVQVKTDDGSKLDLHFINGSDVMVQFLNGQATFTDPLSGVTVGDNYYYSRPEMAVYGTATIDGVTEPVVGTGWFDREWDACCFGGYFHNPPIGTQWDWAGFHLSDGSSWSYYDIFTEGNRNAKMNLTANYLESPLKDCAQGALTASQFTLTHSGTWVSPHSGHTYPTSWHFVVPSKGLDVTVTPAVQDQEATEVPVALGFAPWYEGWAHVTGKHNGVPVTGDGYVELFGYPASN